MNEKKKMRWATSLIGILFLSCGLWVIHDSDATHVSALVAGIVLVILGGESLYSAIKGRDSILSKLGPLP